MKYLEPATDAQVKLLMKFLPNDKPEDLKKLTKSRAFQMINYNMMRVQGKLGQPHKHRFVEKTIESNRGIFLRKSCGSCGKIVLKQLKVKELKKFGEVRYKLIPVPSYKV